MSILTKINLSFLRSGSIGLDISGNTVRFVELGRFFQRMDIGRHGEIRIETGRPADEAVPEAIRTLLKGAGITRKEAAVHLSGKGIRYYFLNAPAMPPESLDAWIRQEILKTLPGRTDLSRFDVSFRIFSTGGQGSRVLAICARQQSVEENIRMLEKAGLRPVSMGGGCPDLASAFLFRSDVFFQETAGLIDARGALMVLEKGVPVYYREFSGDTIHTSGKKTETTGASEMMSALAAWQDKTGMQPDRVIFAGPQKDFQKWQQKWKMSIPFEPAVPLEGMTNGKKQLPPEFTLAAGLALRKYFPVLDTINLVPETTRKEYRKAAEKIRSMRFILGYGLFVLLMMIVGQSLLMSRENRLAALETEIASLDDRIYAVERGRKEQQKMTRMFRQMQQLAAQRSRFGELMDQLAGIVPARLWLGGITIDDVPSQDKPNHAQNEKLMMIRGWAFHERTVAELLSGMENSPDYANVRLAGTRRLSPDDVWKKSHVQRTALVEFSLEALLKDNR